MAVNTRNSIVTNGLVLNLDALNSKSIPLDPTVNQVLWSQNFSQSAWSKSTYDTLTTGSSAPDGTSTATLVDETNAYLDPAVFAQASNIIRANGTTITYSIYTKKGTATSRNFLLRNTTTSTNFTFLVFQYSISSSAAGWTVQDVGDGWFRLAYTQTTGITPGNILAVYAGRTSVAASGSTATWYLWGAQVESTSYATPYIQSTSTLGRRNAWGDLSENNNNATLATASISSSIPQYSYLDERVLNFDGTGSYAQSPRIITGSTYTVEVVFNADTVTAGLEKWLVSQYPGTDRVIFDIYADNKLRNFMGNGTNPSSAAIYSTTTIQPRQWYYATFIKDTLGTGSLYVNGIRESVGSLSTGTPPNSPIQIGGSTSFTNRWFDGKIALTKVYNRALSQQEITQNYNAAKTRFGL